MGNFSGTSKNLFVQLEKLYRHNRQGSYQTRKRYYEAMKRFCVYLGDEYHLQKLGNISEKHFRSYVDHLYDAGKSSSYIKTELSAIRFWHDQIPNAKNELPTNEELSLENRDSRQKDRAWSDGEFNRMLAQCWLLEKESYLAILCLGRYAGLRIHECFRLDRAAAENALKTGMLTVKGKGGLVRSAPINESIAIELKALLPNIKRGHKLFVEEGDSTDKAIKAFQQFIRKQKKNVQDLGSERPLTFHGLRHLYASEQYQKFKAQGYSDREARLKVAKLLGHGRDEVTKIYLTSLERVGESEDE